MNARTLLRLTLIVLVLCGMACSSGGGGGPQLQTPPTTAPQGADADQNPRPARVLTLPGEAPAAEPSPGDFGWKVPDGWTVEKPASSMRLAQYRVPGENGEGECVVFYFGPGQGGDPESNTMRWAGQFEQSDGRSSLDVLQVTELPGTPLRIQLVEVTGTYDGGMTMTDAPAEKKPGYMLLGAIAQGPDAPWFFKFTGPEATVKAQRTAFVGMLESLGR